MLRHGLIVVLLVSISWPAFSQAQELADPPPFPVYPETTKLGDFLCDLWFWRGEPPCFKTTVMHGAYIRFPTRQKARIIVDSYLEQGLYSREILTAFFGTLMVGTYRPDGVAPVGDFWDSGYRALVKLGYPLEARSILWDLVFQRDWAKGKFVEERYKALKVLSNERLITLREYEPLKRYLEEEIAGETIHSNWANELVTALSSFREWNEELLPLYRKVFKRTEGNDYEPVLQAFMDFNIPDDGVFIMDQVLQGTVSRVEDKKLCIRTAYILDDEYAYKKLKEMHETMSKNEDADKDLLNYIEKSLARMDWFGRWEIISTRMTLDDGLDGSFIMFRLANSLNPEDDIVDFSMPMQLTDPEELLPIGTDQTFLTNNISFEVTTDTLVLKKYIPEQRNYVTKEFSIREGTGRDAGKFYLRFPVEGEVDRRGNPVYGWVEVEKIS
jgi:hypothetical protein